MHDFQLAATGYFKRLSGHTVMQLLQNIANDQGKFPPLKILVKLLLTQQMSNNIGWENKNALLHERLYSQI